MTKTTAKELLNLLDDCLDVFEVLKEECEQLKEDCELPIELEKLERKIARITRPEK